MQWVHSPHSASPLSCYLIYHSSISPPLLHIIPLLHFTSTSPHSLTLTLTLSPNPFLLIILSPSPSSLLLQNLRKKIFSSYKTCWTTSTHSVSTELKSSPQVQHKSNPQPLYQCRMWQVAKHCLWPQHHRWVHSWKSPLMCDLELPPDLTDKILCVKANVTVCVHNYVTQVTGRWR